MRTTVDLDERVMAIARAKASGERISLGRAISDLVLEGLSHTNAGSPDFPTFAPTPGHVITDDLVAQYRDDD